MSSVLLALFSELPDPRRDQGKMYPLAPILLFTVLGMLAGARSYRQVHAFIRTHLDRLNSGFGLSLRRAPAYSSVRFILRGLDAADIERVFRVHAAGLAEVPAGGASWPAAVAIDGKTLRGSVEPRGSPDFDAFNDRKAAHLLSAFAADGQIILGHLAIAEKSNEIPAAQEMPCWHDDRDPRPGRTPVHPGRHALSKKTFETARDTGNHLLVQLKANQAKLFDAVCNIADTASTVDTAFSRNTGRSRQEDRTVEVFPVGDALDATEWQPFVKTIITPRPLVVGRVTRHTLLRSAATGLWDQRGEVAYYLSSATGLTPTAWGDAIRGHWGVENRNHYVRDVSCDEDKSRIRDNPGIMARARSFALNILRKNRVTNVANALWNGALNLDHILAYKKI